MVFQSYSDGYSEGTRKRQMMETRHLPEFRINTGYSTSDPPGTRTRNQRIKRCSRYIFISVDCVDLTEQIRWLVLLCLHCLNLVILTGVLKWIRFLCPLHSWSACTSIAITDVGNSQSGTPHGCQPNLHVSGLCARG